jgi:glutathione synthase
LDFTVKLAFIIDPIDRLDPTHDTSVALMEAAQILGHEVWITQANSLTVIASQTWATVTPVQLTPVTLGVDRWVAAETWFELGKAEFLLLETFDVVWMRTDPPVNTAYLYATYLLDYVNPAKTRVVNSPSGIRAANEKMYALQFLRSTPTTIVTQNKQVIRDFLAQEGRVVMKPLGGKAGEGILFLEEGDRNFNSLIEISTVQGTLPVMVQTYLPDAKLGDKRVVLLNGEPIGAVNRVPTGDDFRGNMAVGGRADQVDVTDRDREIAAELAPQLRQDGLIFVGIDIIGGRLTEVNVTSPTGLREIDRLSGLNTGAQVMQWLEQG